MLTAISIVLVVDLFLTERLRWITFVLSLLTLAGASWITTMTGVDQRTVQLSLDEIQNSAWSLPYYLTALGYIVGVLILAVGAARAGLISQIAAGLLVVAVLMTGTETMIVSNAYFIAGSVLLLIAGTAVAVSLRQGVRESAAWTSS